VVEVVQTGMFTPKHCLGGVHVIRGCGGIRSMHASFIRDMFAYRRPEVLGVDRFFCV